MLTRLADAGFSGSYAAGDVCFLLQRLTLQPIDDVLEKERLIQSGAAHYSELIGREALPTADYLALFYAAVEANAARMAADLLRLTSQIRAARGANITLVSLARAGTPVGVLLRRLLARLCGVDVPHYCISIIRDRGVDAHALDHILARHAPDSLVFVDGWTAKGTIAGELARSLADFNATRGTRLAAELFVLCDLSGQAHASGSTDDYLIPSALLNATVSGLVSRTILNDQIRPGEFHGCLFHADWRASDLSCWFVDRVESDLLERADLPLAEPLPEPDDTFSAQRLRARTRMRTLVHTLSRRHDVNDPQLIKPGIGEATRALLRRAPRLLLLRDPSLPEVRHLVHLARERQVAVQADATLGVHAVAVIRKLADG